MQALIIPMGSAGDVHPFIRLAIELRKHGHSVTVATSEPYRKLAEAEGLDFISMLDSESHNAILQNEQLWDPRRGPVVYTQTIVLPHVRMAYDLIAERRERGLCDVVVAPAQLVGARIAQEKLGVPLATAHTAPYFYRSAVKNRRSAGFNLPGWFPAALKRGIFRVVDSIADRWLGRGVNDIRAELGLPPARAIFWDWWNSPQLIIGMFPPWFAQPQPDWPECSVLSGFPKYDGPDAVDVPPELDAFLSEGEPPLLFTPGSGMAHGRHFFEESLHAAKALNRRAVLITRYPDQLPTPLPAGVVHFPFVPLPDVLPRVAAAIHHGGIGTTAHCLAAGTPQMIVYMGFDQADNAHRAEKLGVACSMPAKAYDRQGATERLSRLLSRPDLPENLRNSKGLANSIDEVHRLEAAVEAIELLANSKGDGQGTLAPVVNRKSNRNVSSAITG